MVLGIDRSPAAGSRTAASEARPIVTVDLG
jgi:hypothetical protein